MRRDAEVDKALASAARDRGFDYTARYILMFGADDLSPWFWDGMTAASEAFYKKCVEAKKPWDYFQDEPEEGMVL